MGRNSVMTAEQFVYWLQGYLELSDSKNLTEKQVAMVKLHLEYVFSPLSTPGNSPETATELKTFC